jgi:hypothetical protein
MVTPVLSAPAMAVWAISATCCNSVSRSSSSSMLRLALTSIRPSIVGVILSSAAAWMTRSAASSLSCTDAAAGSETSVRGS